MAMEVWDVWYPNAAARGLSFALGHMEHFEAVWMHAVPDSVRVEVRDADDGRRLAFGDQLKRTTGYFPMTLFERSGESLVREDRWPTDSDLGAPVLLPGGEVGILTAWHNAADGSSWRWSVEFSNHG